MATDFFTNTNNTLLNTHDSRWDLADSRGGIDYLEIYNNQLRAIGSWGEAAVYFNNSQSADQSSQMTLKGSASGLAVDQSFLVLVRAGASTLGYSANLVKSGSNYTQVAVEKDDAWFATLGSGLSLDVTQDHVVKIVAYGTTTTTITVYVDGIFIGSATDSSSPITTGYPGFLLGNFGTEFEHQADSWSDESPVEETVKIVDPDMGSDYNYDSLYDWEAAQQADITAQGRKAVAKCRCTAGTADTTSVTIGGWTTSATQYIKIWTDTTESYRHNGTYQTGNKYRLIVTNVSAINIYIADYMRFDGLQIYVSAGNANYQAPIAYDAISVSNRIDITNCILRSHGADYTSSAIMMGGSGRENINVINCVIYGFITTNANSRPIATNGNTANIYNTTIVGGYLGLYQNAGTTVAQNCYVGGSEYCYAGTITMTTCASSDDLGTAGLQDVALDTTNFINVTAGSEDLHLTPGSALIGVGTNLYNDANYPFQDDIDGNDRGGSGHFWSIGADGGYEERTFVIDPDMGTGYDYDSLYDWEAAQQKTCVCPEVAKCRCTGGTTDSTQVSIDGWTTSATQYIKVWTDTTEIYRHNGTWQTGNKYRIYTTTGGDILTFTEDNVRVDGIQISFNGAYACNKMIGINSPGVNNCDIQISNNIIIGDGTSGWEEAGVDCFNTKSSVKIWNNIFKDLNTGIYENLCDSPDTNYVYNNTFTACLLGINAAYANTVVKNCIFSGCTTDISTGIGTLTDTYCSTSNDNTHGLTAGGTGNRFSQTFSFFGAADFHLKQNDTGALGYGTNLYNDSILPFQTDIDGQDRGGSGHFWSIGADGGYEERTFVIDPDMGTGYDYDSLYDWEAAQQKVTVCPEVAKCRCTAGTADTTAVAIMGWTTSVTQYVKVWTDPAESYRHNGTWQTGNKYRLTTPSDVILLQITDCPNVKICGLQLEITVGSSNYNINIYGTFDEIYVLQCIFKNTNVVARGVYQDAVGDCYVINNLFIDFTSAYGTAISQSDRIGAYLYAYNNTIINCLIGIDAGFSDCYIVAKNNLYDSQGLSGADGYVGIAQFHNSDYNISDISGDTTGISASYRSGEITNVTYLNEGADDFHLALNDTGALSFGLNLYNDANYPFQTDIDGQDRGGSGAAWDIGADQHMIFPVRRRQNTLARR